MKEKSYRVTVIWGLVVAGFYSLYHAYMSLTEGNILIFSGGFIVGIPIGIYLDILLKRVISKRILDSEIVFTKEELYKNQVYGLMVGIIVLVGLFTWVIVLLLNSINIVETIKIILFYGSAFNGFWAGMLFTAVLLQYIWVHSWEKRFKTRLIEKHK